jgi:quinol---cytochrome-c reductase cytochrome c subunit
VRRAALLTLAAAGIGAVIWVLATTPATSTADLTSYSRYRSAVLAQVGGPVASTGIVARGRALFQAGCASCHGFDARGVKGQGPSLIGVGALSADFYLSTGRMPLNNPADPPVRSHPTYTRAEIKALTAYVGSLGGPAIPAVHPAGNTLAAGRKAFTDHCAGCHQVMARGGIVTGAIAPPLREATPTQIAEAVRIGPYLMPAFSTKQIDDKTLNGIARYVVWATRHPDNRGGWGLGNIGPIPEGMVAWLIGIIALLFVIRLIGERTRT